MAVREPRPRVRLPDPQDRGTAHGGARAGGRGNGPVLPLFRGGRQQLREGHPGPRPRKVRPPASRHRLRHGRHLRQGRDLRREGEAGPRLRRPVRRGHLHPAEQAGGRVSPDRGVQGLRRQEPAPGRCLPRLSGREPGLPVQALGRVRPRRPEPGLRPVHDRAQPRGVRRLRVADIRLLERRAEDRLQGRHGHPGDRPDPGLLQGRIQQDVRL